MGGCDHPLAGDDGSPAGVAVAVVQAHLPGPPPQWSLPSSYDPGQLCSGSTLWRHPEIRSRRDKETDCGLCVGSALCAAVLLRCVRFVSAAILVFMCARGGTKR